MVLLPMQGTGGSIPGGETKTPTYHVVDPKDEILKK